MSRLTKLAQDPPPVEGIRHRLLPLQTLRQPCEFESGGIRFPNHSSVFKDTNNRPGGPPAQRLHTIPRTERSRLAKRLDDGNQGVAIQNARNVVGDSGCEFASPDRLKIGKNDIASSTAYVGEGISVEEEKWC